MKVLGLNFGRKKGECRKYLDIALAQAALAGAEVELINTVGLKINRCIGCGYCSKQLESGTKQITCCQKDDYEELADKVLDADAIIVAAPVYVLGPVGQVKDFVDRFGPAHDKAYMLFENALREDTEGMVPLEKNCLKRHLVSYISIGGAKTDHWVSFGLSQLNLFGMSLNMKVVDQINGHATWDPETDKDVTAKSERLGRRIVEAFSRKNSEITWESDPGQCPVCHCSEMTLNGTDTVCCPVCGIYGTLKFEADHQVRVEFTEEEISRSRLKLSGVLEHQEELGRKHRYPKYDAYLKRFREQEDVL